jgi:small subunit ribosomal protein S15
MARMHAKRRGKSGSKRPAVSEPPAWSLTDSKEIQELIIKYAKEGLSSAEIGIRLRDQHAVPSVKLATGKSIVQIMKEGGIKIDIPEDLENLMRRAVRINAHLKTSAKDLHNTRGLHLVEAKIRRLVRYYKETNVLPPEWEYSIKSAELLVK